MWKFVSCLLIALVSQATAQTVQQSGTVTARHLPYWVTSGVIGDGGSSADSPISSIGVTNNGGQGICVSSDRQTAAGRNQLCLGAQTNGPAIISLQNFGTAPAEAISFDINGVVTFPLFAAASIPLNHVLIFGSGGVVQDSGLIASGGVVTTGTWQGSTIGIPFGGCGATSVSGCLSNLGIGTLGLQNANSVAITGGTITGMPLPANGSDVANKQYVDTTATGLNILAQSLLASTTVLPNSPTYSNGTAGVGATLTAGSNTTLTVDGTSAPLNTVILVKNQASAFQNGIYTVTTAGSGAAAWVLTRATYFDQPVEMKAGSYTFITGGVSSANTAWTLQTAVTTVGTDPINFVQFSSGTSTTIAGNSGAFTLTQPLTNVANSLLINATITPQGRLTLTSVTPVMGTSVAAATTVYYTPYIGNLVPLYDGTTNFVPTAFPEVFQTTTDTTKSPAALPVNTNVDVFAWMDGTTPRISRGFPWTNDTTRAFTLTLVNGIYLNTIGVTNGPAALRGTYVGTIRGNASATVDYIFGSIASGGGQANFGIWNAYNRVPVKTFVGDSTVNWNYAVPNVWRAPNNNATMRVSAVRGLDIDGVDASYYGLAISGAATSAVNGVGLNSTSIFSGLLGFISNTTNLQQGTATYSGLMGQGFVFVSAIEFNTSSTASTWIGGGGVAFQQTGLTATMSQ